MAFSFGFKDVIDILLVAVILYETYRLLRRTGAKNLFWGILAFIIVWFLVSYVFQLDLTGALFDRIISVGAIALIVIFQEEIRMFFYRVGSRFSSWKIFDRHGISADEATRQQIQEVTQACRHMAKTKTGALIVLAGSGSLKEVVDSGEKLDAAVSARLIENIFFKNTPLHDGALVIRNGRMLAAACILPVSKDLTIPQHYGIAQHWVWSNGRMRRVSWYRKRRDMYPSPMKARFMKCRMISCSWHCMQSSQKTKDFKKQNIWHLIGH